MKHIRASNRVDAPYPNHDAILQSISPAQEEPAVGVVCRLKNDNYPFPPNLTAAEMGNLSLSEANDGIPSFV